MAVIDWWNLPLILVVFFFALCLLLLARSIAGITCCACHSSGTFFSMWHTHTHTHTSLFFYSVTLAVIDWWNGALCSCSIFLCNVLAATWSIAGIACRACCSSGTFFSLWLTHTHACVRARAHTHTHTHARTHAHTHVVHAGWVVFVFFIYFFSIHVGHDHGLVRCIVFAHVFVNVPVWSPQYYLWYFSMNNHSFVNFLAHHPTSSF